MRFLLQISCLIGSCVFLCSAAQAHVISAYCNTHKNTAQTISCLNQALERIQSDLKNEFENQLKLKQDSEQETLRQSHKAWLLYRNSMCPENSVDTTEQSVQRLNYLSCMVRLTQNRVDTLQLEAMSFADKTKEHGIALKWKNVLLEDFPDVYWQFSKAIEKDLNCNGHIDYVVNGLVLKEERSENDKNITVEFLTAIVEQPLNGRPEVQSFSLQLLNPDNLEEERKVCRADYALEVEILPAQKPQSIEDKSCVVQRVQARNGLCGENYITWSGKEYEMIHRQNDQLVK